MKAVDPYIGSRHYSRTHIYVKSDLLDPISKKREKYSTQYSKLKSWNNSNNKYKL